MKVVIYRMDKQQGPTVKQGNCVQYPVINHTGKEYEPEGIHIYITESLCQVVEIDTNL